MNNTLTGLDHLTVLLFVGLAITGFLLLLAILLQITRGLFWARSPQKFKEDVTKSAYKKEREIGLRISHLLFVVVPPFFVAFLLILCWLLLK